VLEYGLIKEEERFPVVGTVVYANMFTRDAWANGDIGIVLPPERFPYGFAFKMVLPIFS